MSPADSPAAATPDPATSAATTPADLAVAVTLLFVPGDRPERFAKAVAAGADVIVLDLEDAVAPEAKTSARQAVVDWLSAGNPGVVRINAADTPWHHADLEALAPHAGVLFLPKAQDPEAIAQVAARLPVGAGVFALIETAAGVLRAPEIAAVEGVVRLAFGNFDLAAELGLDPHDREALAPLRSSVALASAAAGLPFPVDGVTGSVTDLEPVAHEARQARRVGYGAKLCIHPKQVPVVAEAFAPTPEELDWARRVMAGAQAAEHGAVVVDGAMIDKPVVDRAARILAQRRSS